jgi:glycosyltransferase involved in cell wall biosynthesis
LLDYNFILIYITILTILNIFIYPMQKIKNSEPKTICFITPLYLPAQLFGSGMVIKDLAESLAPQNKVHIITSDGLDSRYWYDPIWGKRNTNVYEVINKVRIHRISCTPVISAFLFLLNRFLTIIKQDFRFKSLIQILSWGPYLTSLERCITKIRPDYIIISPFPTGLMWMAYETCRKLGYQYSVIPFIKPDNLFKNEYLKKILDDAQIIFCPTNTEIEYAKNITNNRSFRILPSSIDTDFLNKNKLKIDLRSENIRRQYGLLGQKVILFSGIKGKMKGAVDLLYAISEIQNRNVVFISIGLDTPEWINAKRNTKLSVRHIDLQYQDGIDKFSFYNIADLLVLPSTSDNFPLVFLEAWYFGKPVIAYDYYSMSELLADGSGLLVECGNIRNLKLSIDKIINTANLAVTTGRIGQKKVLYYDRRHIAESFFDDLQSMEYSRKNKT